MSTDDLSPEELGVLAALQAADPGAADRLAALDEASRARVVAHLGQPVTIEQLGPITQQPEGPEPEPVKPQPVIRADGLSPDELGVLAALQAADPGAADRLAALDEASRARVVAHLGQPVTIEQLGPITQQPEGPEPELVKPQPVIRADGLSPDELGVLAALQAADPGAADRLAALDEASQLRVLAHLGKPVKSGQADPISEQPTLRPQPESVASAGSSGWGLLGWAFVSIAVVVLAVAGYGLYGRLVDNDTANGSARGSTVINNGGTEDNAGTDPTGASLPETNENQPGPSAPDGTAGTDPTGASLPETNENQPGPSAPETTVVTSIGQPEPTVTSAIIGDPDGDGSQNAAIAVSAGSSHSCGLRVDGSVICWGNNDYGQAETPAGTFTAVAAGVWHSCGLRVDGSVICWGNNDYGEVDAPAGTFTAVAAGGGHSCGLRVDGSVICWGNNDYGQLDAPAGTFTDVAAGVWHSCGLRVDGSVICWGNNDYGQAEAPAGTFTDVAAGVWHSCGLRVDGSVICWGNNDYGEVDAPAGTFTDVAAGVWHSCGLRVDGSVICWGYNDYGMVDAPAGTFTAVAAGGGHSCGLRVDGSVICWGNNGHEQVEGFTAVSAPETTAVPSTTAAPVTTAAAATTVVEEWELLDGKFISVIVSAESRAAALRAQDDLEQQYGRVFGILLSDDYASLRPGYWVVYAGPLTPRGSTECLLVRLGQTICRSVLRAAPLTGS